MKRFWATEEEFFEYTRGLSRGDILKLPVRNFPWSTRTANALFSAKIDTVDKLCAYTEARLLMIRNLGRKSLHEVKLMLALLGVHLEGAHSIVVVPPGIRTMGDWFRYEARLRMARRSAKTRKEKSLANGRKIVAEHARMKSALEGLRDYLRFVSPRLGPDDNRQLLHMVDVGLAAS